MKKSASSPWALQLLKHFRFSVPVHEGLSVSISLPTHTPFGHEVYSYSDFCFDFYLF